jgi:exosortase A-associated hydrolase 1
MSAVREDAVVLQCEGESLVGILHVPEREPARIGVVVIVGGPQYRVGSHRQFVLMARSLAQSGYAVLRFDYRGMGDSDGQMRSFESVAADVRVAIDTLMRTVPSLTGVALWGLCDAASVSLMYCTQDARVKGVAIANPWVRSQAGQAQSYIKHYYGQRLLQRSFWVKVLTGKLHVTASVADFVRKLWSARSAGKSAAEGGSFIERMRLGLQKFSGPTLILMSERDLTAQEFRDLSAASADWQKALRREGVTTIDLPGADHTFSTEGALQLATRHSLEWLRSAVSSRSAN